MDVMYWTFPHLYGEWSVKAGDSATLVNGGSELGVKWVNGIPLDKNTPGCRVPTKTPTTVGNATANSAWDTQIGGTHYTDMKIQPFQYSMANKLDPMQHTIIKYVSRFRAKGGIEDLEKAKQTIDLLIAYEKESPCN